jgi:hypothetical protein
MCPDGERGRSWEAVSLLSQGFDSLTLAQDDEKVRRFHKRSGTAQVSYLLSGERYHGGKQSNDVVFRHGEGISKQVC